MTRAKRVDTRVSTEDAAMEQKWVDGNRAAWRRLLTLSLGQLKLGEEGEAKNPVDDERVACIAIQLEDVRAQLRDACEDFGDNDWDEDLALADVVSRHLTPYLHDAAENAAKAVEQRDKRIEELEDAIRIIVAGQKAETRAVAMLRRVLWKGTSPVKEPGSVKSTSDYEAGWESAIAAVQKLLGERFTIAVGETVTVEEVTDGGHRT
jgi:hypothetical protein